jgi:DNA-binding response OmpR family regulator
MRVLVVEDDYKIASFVTNGLKQAGFNMKHAADGEEGLRLILTEPYDAAVVDLMLPQMDGLTLIEELRRQNVNTPAGVIKVEHSDEGLR